MKGKKIAIYGVYPPPLGGISNHILRLKNILEVEGNKVIIYNSSKGKKKNLNNSYSLWTFRGIISGLINRNEIVHFHESSFQIYYFPFILINKLMGKKVIITYHSMRNKYNKYFYNWIFNYQNILSDVIIVVNENIKHKIRNKENIKIIPAFIPPIIALDDKIPKKAFDFANSHDLTICANAYKLDFYKGEDLYGVDMLIDLIFKLKKIYNNIGMLFFLSSIGNKDYFIEIKKKIKEYDISNNFLIITGNYQFYPILSYCDMFIRPTNTDGDSISIREALYFNLITIASNVVKRPKGTIIFRNRDIGDLYQKVLNNINRKKNIINPTQNFNQILDCY